MGCCGDIECCRGTPCSRERFFVGTRKTDDGDAGGASQRRSDEVSDSVHAQGARGAPWTPGIRGTAGVVRELCGLFRDERGWSLESFPQEGNQGQPWDCQEKRVGEESRVSEPRRGKPAHRAGDVPG